MISIVKLFRDEIRIQEEAGLGIENLKKQEQTELNGLIELNEKRNKESALLRYFFNPFLNFFSEKNAIKNI